MRFGSWTYNSHQVRLKRDKKMVNLEDYNPSGIWDIIEAPGTYYYFSNENKMELVYTFKIRRKTLFYTVNLIIPTVFLCFLSIFVFYLPADEGEKMTFCISILLALIVFLLLVSKILPPTSTSVPLVSKYLLFTFIMNILTILNTVVIINWNYRSPCVHQIPKWFRIIFINYLPKILFIKNLAQYNNNNNDTDDAVSNQHSFNGLKRENSFMKLIAASKKRSRVNSYTNDKLAIQFSHEVMEAAQNVTYIINHIKSEKDYQEVIFYIYFKF